MIYVEKILTVSCRPPGEPRKILHLCLMKNNQREGSSLESIINAFFGIWIFFISRYWNTTRKAPVTYNNEIHNSDGRVYVMSGANTAIDHQNVC